MKLYQLRPDQDAYQIWNRGSSGVLLQHGVPYTEEYFRVQVGYDPSEKSWLELVGEGPPECDEIETVAKLAERTAAVRDWSVGSVARKYNWKHVRALVTPLIHKLVNAAVLLGRASQADTDRLDETGALVVLNSLLQWATTHDTPKANSQGKQSESTPSASAVEALLGNEAQEILEIARSAKSADDRMRAICGIDHRYLQWDSPQWANLLDVSDAAIRKTQFWKVDRLRALEALRRE